MVYWQDWVLATCVLAFNIALIPSLFGKQKPRLTTSIMTATFLIPQSFVFYSLSLWYSFAMSALNAGFWSTLAYQRYRQDNK